MTQRSITEKRLDRVSAALGTAWCDACGTSAFRIVVIPEGGDADAPELSAPCPVCGRAPGNVVRIVGMSEAEYAASVTASQDA